MSASRVKKDSAVDIAPYLWNAPPPPSARPAVPANHGPSEAQLQERYQRGFRDGEIAGREAKADEAVEQLVDAVIGLAGTRSSLFRSAQSDILHLAIAVARRILHREILMSTDVLGGVIVTALDRIEDQDLYRVRVHPSFVGPVEKHLAERASGRSLEVVGDASLALGGCVFETHHGNIDAGIESQLSEVERGLADNLQVLR